MTKPTFIFDYDGTLCDTLDAITDALASTILNFTGRNPGPAELRSMAGSGKTLEESFLALGGAGKPFDDASLARWVEHYRQRYDEDSETKIHLFEGAVECLDAMRCIGNVVLLSNKGSQAIERSLRRFGIRERFHRVFAEEPGQAIKPHPDVFSKRIAAAMPGIEASACVVIGDTSADLLFAKNIGAQSCFARYGFGDRTACEAIGYTHAIEDISEVAGIWGARALRSAAPAATDPA